MEKDKSGQKSILVIEDEVEYQELHMAVLGKAYAVAICASAEEALEVLKTRAFDLVLMDVNLMGMTGLAALEQMRQAAGGGAIPVVMCSALPDPAVKAQALSQGAAGFVSKPFDSDELMKVVGALLAGR